MALQYTLVVLGPATPEQLWSRLHDASPEPTIDKGVLRADERDEVGYIVTVRRAQDGYYEYGDDLRTPRDYVRVGFRVADRDGSPPALARNLLGLVQNVLDSGDEDLWLDINGEELILERVGGEVRRVPAGFWNNVER
ncbi:SitI3 family protein [Solirubrobacter taibaiensis]|nr:SitI3 family protein [Solirubrobacter taibaiensis]